MRQAGAGERWIKSLQKLQDFPHVATVVVDVIARAIKPALKVVEALLGLGHETDPFRI